MTYDEIQYLKNVYKNYVLVKIVFNNETFIFRNLTRSEFKYIYRLPIDKYEMEDLVCKTACVYPEEYDFSYGLAGLPEYASGIIEDYSGFRSIDIPMGWYYAEKENTTLETQALDLIKAFIPEYTYEEMEDWTWKKLMEMTARAERVAKYRGFNWELEDKSGEFNEKLSNMNSDNKEFVKELYYSGIDPMYYFKDEIAQLLKKKVVDFPLITSGKWNNEDVLDAVRRQGITL